MIRFGFKIAAIFSPLWNPDCIHIRSSFWSSLQAYLVPCVTMIASIIGPCYENDCNHIWSSPIAVQAINIFRFTGLYQGFGISLFGIIIFRACFFGSYDTMKALAYDDPSKAPIWAAFAFGFAAETIAGLVAYPIDTGLINSGNSWNVKSRQNVSISLFKQSEKKNVLKKTPIFYLFKTLH